MVEILKVTGSKTGQKRVTIPRDHHIEVGDYVAVEKITGIERENDEE